jgi:hypothetical protein
MWCLKAHQIEIQESWGEHCTAACWFDMELPCSDVRFEVHAKELTNFVGIFGTPVFCFGCIHSCLI